MSDKMLKSGQANIVLHQHGTNNDHLSVPASRRDTKNQINVTGTRSSCLRFLNRICEPVFTGVCIKGEHSEPLMVALVDAHSGIIVTSSPEASIRVKIVVLDADSGGCQDDTWTPEEFRNKIIGNKRLLTGDIVLELKEGIGFVGKVWFSHTKAWKKKHAYMLGAVPQDDYFGTQIRNGFSESFFVKDRRLELNKKHHPPALSDEVWRLNGIGRYGAFHKCLNDDEVNIKTVGDFLKKLNTDPQKLRNIFGEGMSAKSWKVIVDHALTCLLDGKLYMYSPQSQQKTSVVFNVVGQVKGLISGSEYYDFEMMSESRKAHSTDLVASAFQQWDRVVSFDEGTSIVDKCLELSNVDYHMKSLITQSSSGPEMLILSKSDESDCPQPDISFDNKTMENCNSSKIIFSPKFDGLDFPQLGLPDDDMTFVFDEYQSMSKRIRPPKSPLKDSSSASQILFSQDNDEIAFPLPAFSSNDHSPILEASGIICPPKHPNQESSSGTKILISPEIDEFGHQHPVVSFQEIISTWDSVWNMNYYYDPNWN